jgi:predicted nucleotidyltransferase
MDKTTALACVRRYAEEVTKELKPEKIVMFGSYAAGQPHDDSDIDVAVIFNGFEGDVLRVSSWLWSLTWKVSSYIEPILLDISDDKSGFAEEVLRTGEVIYQQ